MLLEYIKGDLELLIQALNALHMVLNAGLHAISMRCSKCSADHLDSGVFTMKTHKKYAYKCCSTTFR